MVTSDEVRERVEHRNAEDHAFGMARMAEDMKFRAPGLGQDVQGRDALLKVSRDWVESADVHCELVGDVVELGHGRAPAGPHRLHLRAWHEQGYVISLADAYWVVTVDSLGQATATSTTTAGCTGAPGTPWNEVAHTGAGRHGLTSVT